MSPAEPQSPRGAGERQGLRKRRWKDDSPRAGRAHDVQQIVAVLVRVLPGVRHAPKLLVSLQHVGDRVVWVPAPRTTADRIQAQCAVHHLMKCRAVVDHRGDARLRFPHNRRSIGEVRRILEVEEMILPVNLHVALPDGLTSLSAQQAERQSATRHELALVAVRPAEKPRSRQPNRLDAASVAVRPATATAGARPAGVVGSLPASGYLSPKTRLQR